jgi:hypothetical protein
VRWNSSPALLALVLFAALALGACASKCKQLLVKCRYQCQRNYELCQVKNIDPWYCQNQVGNCDLKCDNDNSTCSSWWW